MSAMPLSRETFPSVRGLEIFPPAACRQEDAAEDGLVYLLTANLPYDDGVPLETNRHRLAMGTLIESVEPALLKLRKRLDFFAGGNMFIHYLDPYTRKAKFIGPDFFVMLNVDGSYPRQSWNVVKEGGHYPDVIVELLSETTAQDDLDTKKTFYEQVFKTAEYFVFDPYNPDSLQGWRLVKRRYQALSPNSQGWLWSKKLSLWLGPWEGAVDPLGLEYASWLRFYDAKGQLALLPKEYEKREKEYERREKEHERREKEHERREKELAQQQAAEAQQQAAQARLRAEQLAQRLRALGINPDDLV
jgi:Uma2 family endonuclease